MKENKNNSNDFESVDETNNLYYRNGEKCKANIIYPENFIDSKKPQFCLIEKLNAKWDYPIEKTYSIGWKCNSKFFVLGIPTQEKDLEEIKSIITKLVAGEDKK